MELRVERIILPLRSAHVCCGDYYLAVTPTVIRIVSFILHKHGTNHHNYNLVFCSLRKRHPVNTDERITASVM